MKLFTTFLLVAGLAVAGCGSDKKSSAGSSTETTPSTTEAAASGGGTKLALTADKSALKFDKTTLAAKAGSVTITMANPAGLSHNVSIEGKGVDKDGEVVGQGGKSTVTADLKAGTYSFYCSVDGHEDAGMKGTLTVK